ncbi:DUF2798 domain-containing protein [Marinomonas sp. C2222]|uniref:DUF2798 domain-containing protein n=1 Tax=Marinomonas sargassi TaxID=2984494 RepID=A0ABT2YQ29_9GAMM|nr:DUF2798 domain-containing protein [Marinomonas sargassi]MCV2401991.1 DUF2798 domain-containing protein [Marinomonas sargassi]
MKLRVYFAILMSGIMSLIVSGWVTVINVGMAEHFISFWLKAWLLAWPVAGAVAFLFGPWVQKLSSKLAEKS